MVHARRKHHRHANRAAAELLALAAVFVESADPERVLATMRASDADNPVDVRPHIAGLFRRGLLVSPYRPPPRLGLFDVPRTTHAHALAAPGPMAVA